MTIGLRRTVRASLPIVAGAALLLAVPALGEPSQSAPEPVIDADQVCAAAKASLVGRANIAESVIAFCDVIPTDHSPSDYFVMALHSNRQCEGICSTNMGWFAIEKATGEVFEWNVADWEVGDPVKGGREPPLD